ncbi:MAG: hypothetical protein H7296_05410 [Bacteroidia bacterium]|nr:hypothetical protein [Bacteroidia bacterium]
MNEQLEEIREQRKNKVAGVFKYFSLIMGAFYILMGIIFYFSPFIEQISTGMKLIICLMLIVYGVFRLYRAIKA